MAEIKHTCPTCRFSTSVGGGGYYCLRPNDGECPAKDEAGNCSGWKEREDEEWIDIKQR